MTWTEDKELHIQKYILRNGSTYDRVFQLRGFERLSVFINGFIWTVALKAGF
ncbi:MAG: hypothetical protein ACO24W_06300 [Candidatus Nanopelagicales bacterium]